MDFHLVFGFGFEEVLLKGRLGAIAIENNREYINMAETRYKIHKSSSIGEAVCQIEGIYHICPMNPYGLRFISLSCLINSSLLCFFRRVLCDKGQAICRVYRIDTAL